MAETYAEA